MFEIGLRIYRGRLRRKMTQAELARRAGIPQPNLSNIERGKRDLTVSTLARIARALEMNASDFFARSNEKKPAARAPLTRSRVEKLAWAISGGTHAALDGREKEIVNLVHQILPVSGQDKRSMKASEAAWIQLRGMMNPSEIQVLVERAREMEGRLRK